MHMHITWTPHRDIFLIPFFGNSTATRLVCAQEAHELLVLGDFRAAQRVLLRLPPTDTHHDDDAALHVWVVNMHLDHDHPDRRAAQGEAVVAWMERAKPRCDAVVLCGDLNASPPEPLHALLRSRGYRSAHSMVHGSEPQVCVGHHADISDDVMMVQGTWPSGIEAPLAEEGPFECLDYVYLWEAEGVTCRCVRVGWGFCCNTEPQDTVSRARGRAAGSGRPHAVCIRSHCCQGVWLCARLLHLKSGHRFPSKLIVNPCLCRKLVTSVCRTRKPARCVPLHRARSPKYPARADANEPSSLGQSLQEITSASASIGPVWTSPAQCSLPCSSSRIAYCHLKASDRVVWPR